MAHHAAEDRGPSFLRQMYGVWDRPDDSFFPSREQIRKTLSAPEPAPTDAEAILAAVEDMDACQLARLARAMGRAEPGLIQAPTALEIARYGNPRPEED